MNSTILFTATFIMFLLLGTSSVFALPDPSIAYCQEQGGQVVMIDGVGNQVLSNDQIVVRADCVFNDGTVCDTWSFTRGECGPEIISQESNIPNDTRKDNNPLQLKYIIGYAIGLGIILVIRKVIQNFK